MSVVLPTVFMRVVMFAAVALSGKNRSFHIRFCHLASSVLDRIPPADSKTSCTEGRCSRGNTSVASTSDASPESLTTAGREVEVGIYWKRQTDKFQLVYWGFIQDVSGLGKSWPQRFLEKHWFLQFAGQKTSGHQSWHFWGICVIYPLIHHISKDCISTCGQHLPHSHLNAIETTVTRNLDDRNIQFSTKLCWERAPQGGNSCSSWWNSPNWPLKRPCGQF